MLRDDWFKTHKGGEAETPADSKKRLKNWWYYNKWFVLIAVIAVILLCDFGRSVYHNLHNLPDFQIASLGTPLPQGTVEALEQAFAEIGPDLNGDGKVIVQVNSYAVFTNSDEPPADPALAYASQARLVTDIQAGDSFLFLMENPEKFQNELGILSRIDGTLPLDTPDSEVPVYLRWGDCPVLAGLELGSFSDVLLGEEFAGDNQALLENRFFGHRPASYSDPELAQRCEELWQTLIAGAAD